MSSAHTDQPAGGSGDPDNPKAIRPKDAATLIVVDTSAGEPRVLMGRRRDDLVFMPGKYVFPGGRVDAADRQLTTPAAMRATETAKLLLEMKGDVHESRAKALALAAIRETFEEAGVIIGTPQVGAAQPGSDLWRAFYGHGFAPDLSAVTYFARAITPPGRSRRFDTRFFWTSASAIAHRIEANDGEMSSLHWLSADEARALELATITRVILEDLMDRLAKGGLEDDAAPIPFYHQKNGTFRRDLLRLG